MLATAASIHAATEALRSGVDLRVDAVQHAINIAPGTAFPASDSTRNDGGADARPSTTAYYLATRPLRGALDARIGTELLFPVFKALSGQGSNAKYEIIGWIGFHLTSYTTNGNNATLKGYFTRFIAQGILTSTGGGGGNGAPATFGVKTIQLIG
jgi:hypothetical protein